MLSISSSCCLIGPRPRTGQDSEWLVTRARNSDTGVLKRAVQLIDLPPDDCSHAPNAAGGLTYLGSHITCNSLSRMQAFLHSILLLLSIAYAVIGTWCSLERKRADCGSCMPLIRESAVGQPAAATPLTVRFDLTHRWMDTLDTERRTQFENEICSRFYSCFSCSGPISRCRVSLPFAHRSQRVARGGFLPP